MLVKTYGSAILGVNALMVTVEVNVGDGVGFFMVGLPDKAVTESRQRVKSAIFNSELKLPRVNITANFAPADIRTPLHSPELKEFTLLTPPKVYEYDLETLPNKTYTIVSK